MDTIVLIPAYKPTNDLIILLSELKEKKVDLLVVDDGSGEDFSPIFEQAETYATVIHQNPNQGKGAALKYGIQYVCDNKPECQYIITADADGQHKPSDIMTLSRDLHEKGGFVIGARKFEGEVPFRSRWGNRITRFVFLVAAGKKCSDTQTGLRGFSRDLFEIMLKIKGSRYEYEMNVLMQTAQYGIPIREVPIATVYENNNAGSHFRTVVDAARIYKVIFMNSFLIKYGLSAVACFILDFLLLLLFNDFYKAIIPATWILTATAAATVSARLISSPVNYLINRLWVFRSNANKAASFVGYVVLAICVLIAKTGLNVLLVDVLHVPLAVANISVEVVLFITNFIIQKLLIFRKKKI